MSVDIEIVAGGVWMRAAGSNRLDAEVQACLSATQLKGFVPGSRLLVDARGANAESPSKKEVNKFITHDVPKILEVMPHWGLLTSEIEHWELGREVVRRSRYLESVEFFSDIASGLRWLTETE